MTLDSYIKRENSDPNSTIESTKETQSSKVLRVLKEVIKALGAFEGKEDKKFNLSKLSEVLNMNQEELNKLIELILCFQDTFETVFKNHRIVRTKIKDTSYFILEKREIEINLIESNKSPRIIKIPEIVEITKTQAHQISDIIFLFQRISKGKGFDLENITSEFVEKIKAIMNTHSYFFYQNGGDLIYPTQLCINLGNQILSYTKSNKEIKQIQVNNTKIVVK